MSAPSDTFYNLSRNMLDILGLEPGASRGNVAAHALRVTFASSSDPFAGFNFGWQDQEESTAFLCSIVAGCDDEYGDDEDASDVAHQVADDVVSSLGRAKAIRLAADLEQFAYGDIPVKDGADLYDLAVTALYEVASTIASTLLEGMAS